MKGAIVSQLLARVQLPVEVYRLADIDAVEQCQHHAADMLGVYAGNATARWVIAGGARDGAPWNPGDLIPDGATHLILEAGASA